MCAITYTYNHDGCISTLRCSYVCDCIKGVEKTRIDILKSQATFISTYFFLELKRAILKK